MDSSQDTPGICTGCDPANPGGHRPPPRCLDLGNGEAMTYGTAADVRAAAEWLRQHYPDGGEGPRLGPITGRPVNMGHDLYRMLRASILPELSPGEQAVALVLADICMDETKEPPRNMNPGKRICEDLGISPGTLRGILGRLAARGLELRVPIGKDKHGNPVFAAKGHAVDYQFPVLPPRQPKGASDNAPLESKAQPRVRLSAQRRSPECAPTPTDLTTPVKGDPETGLLVSQPELEGGHARSGQDPFTSVERPSPRTAEETAAEAQRQADRLTEWMRMNPEPGQGAA